MKARPRQRPWRERRVKLYTIHDPRRSFSEDLNAQHGAFPCRARAALRACPRPRPNDAASRVASPAHRRLRAAPRRPPRHAAPQPALHSPSISVKTAKNSQSCCAVSPQQRTRNIAAGGAALHPPSPAALHRARAARRPRSLSACRDAFSHTCGHPHGTPRGERRLRSGPSGESTSYHGRERRCRPPLKEGRSSTGTDPPSQPGIKEASCHTPA